MKNDRSNVNASSQTFKWHLTILGTFPLILLSALNTLSWGTHVPKKANVTLVGSESPVSRTVQFPFSATEKDTISLEGFVLSEAFLVGTNDFGDAPATFGSPSHVVDSAHLRIGPLVDTELASIPSVDAKGDDNDNPPSDEDGIVGEIPHLAIAFPLNYSVTVSNIVNTTGNSATLYAWIDLNGSGTFSAGEIQTVTIPNGFSGNKTLTWPSVVLTGTKPYLRLRLTNDTLVDISGTTDVDERSTSSAASNGEVEDYLIPVNPDLAVSKNDNTATINAGATTFYRVRLTNNGPGAITGANFSDPIVPGLNVTAVACSATPGTCMSPPTVSELQSGFSISLAQGEFYELLVTATVTATSGMVTNTAFVTPSDGVGSNSGSDTDNVRRVIDLVVTKDDGVAVVNSGGSTTYAVTVSNNGLSPADGSKLSDPIAAGLTKTLIGACTAMG